MIKLLLLKKCVNQFKLPGIFYISKELEKNYPPKSMGQSKSDRNEISAEDLSSSQEAVSADAKKSQISIGKA